MSEGPAAEAVHEHLDLPTEIMPTATGLVLTGASPIDLGNGERAPLGELLACRNRRCRFCSEGWVRRIQPGGVVVSAVCGCCVDRYRAQKARQAAVAPVAVRAADLREQERQRERVERLEREVGHLEAERAQRLARFEDSNAELLEAVRNTTATAQDEASLALKVAQEAEHLAIALEEARARVALIERAHAGAQEKLRAHRTARALAEALRGDAEKEIERRRAGLAMGSLEREIAKVRRRLHLARVNSGMDEGAPTVPAPEAA